MLPACVVAVAGLIASGKSTLAAHLGLELGAAVVEADAVRRHLRESCPSPGPGAEPAEEDVYAGLIARAADALAAGHAVVLDACFARRDERGAAVQLADAHGVPFLLAECRLSGDERARRLAERDRRDDLAAGSWLQLADDFAARSEPIDELGDDQHLQLDGAAPVEQATARLAARLRAATPPAAEGAPQ
jgi:predicted kinase